MKEIKSKEYFTLDNLIGEKIVPAFSTQRDCKKHAKSIGWTQDNIVKVERNFEIVYIVCQCHIQPTIIAGIKFDELNIPLGEYETINGTQQMKIVKVKKEIRENN